MADRAPLITFGIIVLNGEPFTRYCLRQLYPHAHQIVVVEGGSRKAASFARDGHSTDGTLEIIEELKFKDSQLVSEPDSGLYDALNKGIKATSGDVVGILHADDFYADDEVLSRVAEVFEDPLVDACYGDLLYVGGDAVRGTRKCWVGPDQLK